MSAHKFEVCELLNPTERIVEDPELCETVLNEGTCGFLNLAGSRKIAEIIKRQTSWSNMHHADSMSDEQRDNSG